MKLRPPRRALLVDLDPASHRRCDETLLEAGYSVTTVETGIDAVVAARAEHPDIIVMSRQLGDVSATGAVEWLRANEDLKTTPIIILGGQTERDAEMASLQPVIVLPTPINAIRLQHAINHLAGTGTAQ
jgi:DNA-binding response OmpR family regulator